MVAGFLWLLRAGALPVAPPIADLQRIEWWVVPSYSAVWSSVLVLRALRWKVLLDSVHPVRAGRAIVIGLIGSAALVALPFRAGEIVRPSLIRRKGEISWWAATGTIGAERIVDGLVVSVLLLLCLRLATPRSPMPDRVGDLAVPVAAIPTAASSAAIAFAVAFAVMSLFYVRRAWARHVIEALIGRLSARAAGWAAGSLASFADGLGFLTRPGRALPFLAATLALWGLNALGIWLVARGCGLARFTIAHAFVALGVQSLGSILPNAPGFFGVFQVSMYAAFAIYFAPEEVVGPGAIAVFVLYTVSVGLSLGAGALALAARRMGAGD